MKSKYPHILQTPEWGRAKSLAQPGWTHTLWVKEKDTESFEIRKEVNDWSKVKASVLILERDLPLGQKLQYIPRGPYVDWEDEDAVREILELIKREAENSNVVFSRFEPDVFEEDFPYELVKKMDFVRTADFVQAQDTVKVDVDRSDDEMLMDFHKKHRYNIRLAKRRGLSVRSSTDPEDVSIFYNLTIKTDKRSGGAMNPHPEEYYQKIVKVLGENDMARVYIVEKEGKPVSASVVFTFGNEAIYMFGAADYKYRRDMPNHLREWVSMTDAREAGRKWFDLWGVTMRDDPGGGIRRYKTRYRDHIDDMAGTFDYAPNKLKYQLFNWVNKLRRAMGK